MSHSHAVANVSANGSGKGHQKITECGRQKFLRGATAAKQREPLANVGSNPSGRSLSRVARVALMNCFSQCAK